MSSGIHKYNNIEPKIAKNVFIGSNAIIIGDVEIGEKSSIWFGCVLRGDVAKIKIGKNTNIQDGSVIHVTRGGFNTIIGDNVTIGHKALIHAAILEDETFVGMGSTMLDEAVIETGGMLGAGSLLTSKKVIKKNELWAGVPARFHRKLSKEEADHIIESAKNYTMLAAKYL